VTRSPSARSVERLPIAPPRAPWELARLGGQTLQVEAGTLMAGICIYCKRGEPTATFVKREHVIWDAFGRFKDPLLLRDAVCDHCNQDFGDGLDRYMARDTIEGLYRYRFNVKPAAEYKSEGKRSKRTTFIAGGRWAGAIIWYRQMGDVLRPTPAPQIGFGKSKDGPFEHWFPADDLPTMEQKQELLKGGYQYAEFLGIAGADPEDNTDAIMAVAAGMGLKVGTELTITMPLGLQTWETLIEDRWTLDTQFWRCVAKCVFNYFAFAHGGSAALHPRFDALRDYIRHGGTLNIDCGWSPTPVLRERPVGHRYQVVVGQFGKPVLEGRLYLLTGVTYMVPLLTGDVPFEYLEQRGHTYHLDTMTITERPRRS
jgi:hypothetical protein